MAGEQPLLTKEQYEKADKALDTIATQMILLADVAGSMPDCDERILMAHHARNVISNATSINQIVVDIKKRYGY